MREWEKECQSYENFERLQYLIQNGMCSEEYAQINMGQNFVYNNEIPQECDRINTDQIHVSELDSLEH